MRNEYLDRNGRTIKRMDILMNELGELILVVDNGDDFGGQRIPAQLHREDEMQRGLPALQFRRAGIDGYEVSFAGVGGRWHRRQVKLP